MNLASIAHDESRFTVRGTCPHCRHKSVFPTVTSTFKKTLDNGHVERLIAAARCQGCNDFILVILHWEWALGGGNQDGFVCEEYYPLDKPSDVVSEMIPEGPRLDFQEALRCHWVKAYSATAEMCRRAVESACLDLGAPFDDVLEKMIDWLEANRIITPTLQEVAHKIRLGGNRGAHPWKGGQPVAKPVPVIQIGEEHASAILQYTSHFLQHVYVIPKQLPTYDFSKPKPEKQ